MVLHNTRQSDITKYCPPAKGIIMTNTTYFFPALRHRETVKEKRRAIFLQEEDLWIFLQRASPPPELRVYYKLTSNQELIAIHSYALLRILRKSVAVKV
jgi:hypothetical protein